MIKKMSLMLVFLSLSINAFSSNYWEVPKNKQKELDKYYQKFETKNLMDKAIEQQQKKEKAKEYNPKTEKLVDYSDVNSEAYTKTKGQVQGNNKYINNVFNPTNRAVTVQNNVRYIMTDVPDHTAKSKNRHTEMKNDDYRGVVTIQGTKKLNPYTYRDDYRPNGSSLGGGHIIYNMWDRDKTPTIRHAKLTGIVGDDKAYVRALSDIFKGYDKPNTAKTQAEILKVMEGITYTKIAKLQIAQENMKLLEEKYKNAESMDAFYTDPNNKKLFEQMAKYHEDLGKAVISTSKLEEMYGQIGEVTSEDSGLKKLNSERLAFLANMAEFSQKLQDQNGIGDIKEIEKYKKTGKADFSKMTYKDLNNISFDKIYALIQKGDKKSIADNMQILDSLMLQNNALFNYSLTTLQAFKRNNSFEEIRNQKIERAKYVKEQYQMTGMHQAMRSLAEPTDFVKENIKKGDPKNSKNTEKDLIRHNSGIAFNKLILGK